MFASEADFLKADKAWREQLQVNNVPSLGGSQGSGGSWLRTGASVAEAAGAYMNGRAIRKRITDVDDALEDSRAAQATIANLQTKYPDLGPALADAFRAERDATIAMVRLLEDQLLAVDIQTGAGVARAVSEMWDGSSTSSVMGMGMGNSGLLAGGVGLGLGLLLSRDDNSNNRSRNRR